MTYTFLLTYRISEIRQKTDNYKEERKPFTTNTTSEAIAKARTHLADVDLDLGCLDLTYARLCNKQTHDKVLLIQDGKIITHPTIARNLEQRIE